MPAGNAGLRGPRSGSRDKAGKPRPSQSSCGYPATSFLTVTAIPRVRLAATIDQMQSSLEGPAGAVSFNDVDEGAFCGGPVISARCQARDDVIGQVPELVFAIVLQILCDGVVEKLARDLVPVGLRADSMRLRYSRWYSRCRARRSARRWSRPATPASFLPRPLRPPVRTRQPANRSLLNWESRTGNR